MVITILINSRESQLRFPFIDLIIYLMYNNIIATVNKRRKKRNGTNSYNINSNIPEYKRRQEMP